MNLLTDDPAKHWLAGLPPWLADAIQASAEPPQLAEGLAGLTRRCGRTREHVARTLKQGMGMSPTELITHMRCRYAARELALSDRSIQEIALDTGIETLSHFYRCFKKQYGTTPRHYRLQARQAAS